MAARKKNTSKIEPMVVSIPRHILKGAKASIDPKRNNEPGTLVMDPSAYSEFYNRSINDIRHARNRTHLLRIIAGTEGPLSTAIHNLVQTASNGYKVFAYKTGTNVFDADGANLAATLISQLNSLYNYNEGFSNKLSFDALLQTMFREAIITNGVGIELVLGKGYIPDHIQVIPLETVQWRNSETGPVPEQYQYGQKNIKPIPLDIPTFWVARMPGDPADLYPKSMMDAAIKLLIFFEEFLEDIRRVVRQSGHARQTVSLDIDKAIDTAPADIKRDSAKLKKWLDMLQAGVQQQLESIEPDEALVLFSTATYKIESPNFGTKIDYTPMLNALAGMWATSMKTPPSAIGMRLDGSSSGTGSVETMIFLKSAKALHQPVETAISRALTLACRLLGADIYVKFAFDPIDLRPEMELESFYTMRQTRVLELLSLGFITDAEAAIMLGVGQLPEAFESLSGTGFADGKAANNQDLPVNPGDTPVGKAMQPNKKIPRKGGGKSQ